MSEKLEQVIAAIDAAGDAYIASGAINDWRDMSLEVLARAAIEALRVPTAAMLAAVEAEEERLGYCPAAFETMGCEQSWPIMIDAVLK